MRRSSRAGIQIPRNSRKECPSCGAKKSTTYFLPETKESVCKRCYANAKKKKVPLSIRPENAHPAPETAEALSCISGKKHYWDIDTPQGPKSKGICRNCKQEATFTNVLESDIGSWREAMDLGASVRFQDSLDLESLGLQIARY